VKTPLNLLTPSVRACLSMETFPICPSLHALAAGSFMDNQLSNGGLPSKIGVLLPPAHVPRRSVIGSC
jgi:hypothetical protein